MDFPDYVEKILGADSVDMLYSLLTQAVEEICGFNRVTFRLLTDHNLINLPANHGISKNYPDNWMAYYMEKGYEKIDPVSRYGLRASLAFSWKEVSEKVTFSREQKKCFYGGIEAGLNHGIAIPLRSAFGQVAGVAAAVDKNQTGFDEEKQIAYMNLICQHFYHRFLQLHEHNPARMIEVPRLSNKEREVIMWAARGKSAEEIADIMMMTEGTVRWYMNEIRKKYNCKNRLTAILMAVQMGEIDLNDLFIAKTRTKAKKAA